MLCFGGVVIEDLLEAGLLDTSEAETLVQALKLFGAVGWHAQNAEDNIFIVRLFGIDPTLIRRLVDKH